MNRIQSLRAVGATLLGLAWAGASFGQAVTVIANPSATIGVADLDVVIEKGETRTIPSWRLVANYGVVADPGVQATVRKYEQQLDREMGQPIGTTETPRASSQISAGSWESPSRRPRSPW